MLAINLTHISPIGATRGLLAGALAACTLFVPSLQTDFSAAATCAYTSTPSSAGAGRLLRDDGLLLIYGPFKVQGRCTTESNAAFDASLRERNPEWGYRDVQDVTDMAAAAALTREEVVEMPANNLMLVFRRRGDNSAAL